MLRGGERQAHSIARGEKKLGGGSEKGTPPCEDGRTEEEKGEKLGDMYRKMQPWRTKL